MSEPSYLRFAAAVMSTDIDFKLSRDLNKLATNVPSKWRMASITPDEAVILGVRANPFGWNFQEMTGVCEGTGSAGGLLFAALHESVHGRFCCKRRFEVTAES
jgi:hypothetical protein